MQRTGAADYLDLVNFVAAYSIGLVARGCGIQECPGEGIGRGVVRAPRLGSESEGKQKRNDQVSHVLRLPELSQPNEIFSNWARH